MLLPKFPTPYYAVVFTTIRTDIEEGYLATNNKLEKMAEGIDGFLGIESARDKADGLGITISYWKNIDAIAKWREHTHHRIAKEKGIKDWYKSYSIRIAKVESDNFFEQLTTQ